MSFLKKVYLFYPTMAENLISRDLKVVYHSLLSQITSRLAKTSKIYLYIDTGLTERNLPGINNAYVHTGELA